MNKEWTKIIRLTTILCLAVLGIVLCILNLPNPFGIVVDSTPWIGFWGSVSGSIISGLITVIVLKKTIESERQGLKREKYEITMENIQEKLSRCLIANRELESMLIGRNYNKDDFERLLTSARNEYNSVSSYYVINIHIIELSDEFYENYSKEQVRFLSLARECYREGKKERELGTLRELVETRVFDELFRITKKRENSE